MSIACWYRFSAPTGGGVTGGGQLEGIRKQDLTTPWSAAQEVYPVGAPVGGAQPRSCRCRAARR
jgi:hypothetical protein